MAMSCKWRPTYFYYTADEVFRLALSIRPSFVAIYYGEVSSSFELLGLNYPLLNLDHNITKSVYWYYASFHYCCRASLLVALSVSLAQFIF
jgi:hypothetical protein